MQSRHCTQNKDVYQIWKDTISKVKIHYAEFKSILVQIYYSLLHKLYGMIFWTKWQKFDKALQSENMTLYKAACVIKILFLCVPQMRENNFEGVFNKCKIWARDMNILTEFENKWKRKDNGNAWIHWEYWYLWEKCLSNRY